MIAKFNDMINQRDKALEEIKGLKHELSESGKNLYEAKNLLKMCRKEKMRLQDTLKASRSDVTRLKEERDSALHQVATTVDAGIESEKDLTDAMEVLENERRKNRELNSMLLGAGGEPDQGNTYWPFYDADLNAVSLCLMLSVLIICVTVYNIVKMVGM